MEQMEVGTVGQAVKYLPSKHEALSSNPSTAKKPKIIPSKGQIFNKFLQSDFFSYRNNTSHLCVYVVLGLELRGLHPEPFHQPFFVKVFF
jgi:hypothetical protein